MSLIDLYEPPPAPPEYGSLPVQTRADVLETLSGPTSFDLLIAGAGMVGSAVAHTAACLGLRTAVLEADDFGSAADVRPPFVMHPLILRREIPSLPLLRAVGLTRYWERVVPSLLAPRELLLAFPEKFTAEKAVWSFLQKFRSSGVRPVDYRHAPLPQLAAPCSVLDQGRLARELLLAARQEGAVALNHCSVEAVSLRPGGGFIVTCREQLTDARMEVRARVVLNTTGVNGPEFARLARSSRPVDYIRYQRTFLHGSFRHFPVVCCRRGPHPFTFIPHGEAGELIMRAGLPAEALTECLSTLRTLLGADKHFAQVQRPDGRSILAESVASYIPPKRALRLDSAGILHAYEVHPFTAPLAAARLARILELGEKPGIFSSGFLERTLPSSGLYTGSIAQFRAQCAALELPQEAVEGAIRRLGSRVRFLFPENVLQQASLHSPSYLGPASLLVGPDILANEAVLYFKTELPATFSDVQRRFGLLREPERFAALRADLERHPLTSDYCRGL